MIDDVLLFICSFCLAFDVFLKLMRLMLFDSKCIVHVHTNLTGRYIPVKVTNSAHAGSVRISEFSVLKQIDLAVSQILKNVVHPWEFFLLPTDSTKFNLFSQP